MAIRHHYIPRFYLRGFADAKGHVYLYEKGQPGFHAATPNNVGLERHFYTASTIEKERDTDLVEGLFAKVDDRAALGLRKLLRREPLSAQERADFACFVALLSVRKVS